MNLKQEENLLSIPFFLGSKPKGPIETSDYAPVYHRSCWNCVFKCFLKRENSPQCSMFAFFGKTSAKYDQICRKFEKKKIFN